MTTTRALFREDAYLTHCDATIVAVGEDGVRLDQTVFYPLGGDQAGDTGALVLADGTRIEIADTHVRNTAEIGALAVAKLEKKSARTRRLVLAFA